MNRVAIISASLPSIGGSPARYSTGPLPSIGGPPPTPADLRWSLYRLKALRAQTPHTALLWRYEAKLPNSGRTDSTCTSDLVDPLCAQSVCMEISLAWRNSNNWRVRAEPSRSEVRERC